MSTEISQALAEMHSAVRAAVNRRATKRNRVEVALPIPPERAELDPSAWKRLPPPPPSELVRSSTSKANETRATFRVAIVLLVSILALLLGSATWVASKTEPAWDWRVLFDGERLSELLADELTRPRDGLERSSARGR